MEKNGFWRATLMTILITLILASYGWTTAVGFINGQGIKENGEKIMDVCEITKDTLHLIEQRLQRIEDNLKIRR